jgi:acetolactate decarboxylase
MRWLMAAALAATAAVPAAAQDGSDTIYQVSTLDALIAGVYDGTATYGEVARHGDLGLGTFNALDGEMVAFDGTIWRITHDGTVSEVGPDVPTPFAAMTPFEADETLAIAGGLDMAGLGALLDGRLADRNTPVAVRIDGLFAAVTVRAPERQEQPYVGLVEALKSQAVWQHEAIAGTMVGFWFPAWLGGLNAAGWHLHFVSDDRTVGGHVLDLETGEATVRLDRSPELVLVLPQTEAFAEAALGDSR